MRRVKARRDTRRDGPQEPLEPEFPVDYSSPGPNRAEGSALKYVLIAFGLSGLLFLILLKVIPWASI